MPCRASCGRAWRWRCWKTCWRRSPTCMASRGSPASRWSPLDPAVRALAQRYGARILTDDARGGHTAAVAAAARTLAAGRPRRHAAAAGRHSARLRRRDSLLLAVRRAGAVLHHRAVARRVRIERDSGLPADRGAAPLRRRQLLSAPAGRAGLRHRAADRAPARHRPRHRQAGRHLGHSRSCARAPAPRPTWSGMG